MNATLFNQLLPADCGIRIGQVSIREENIVVELECTTTTASCPKCHQTTSSLHGRYIRRLQDRPCLGKSLQWRIKARKFVCRNDQCPQKVFCERLPEFADSHARTTTELTSIHQSIGMALGGEAGARLARSLSMTTSPDTILRRVLDTSEQPGPPPRYVGIDDWAIRKGHRNSADLYRHLKTKGYRGSYDAVRRYLNRQIGSSGRPGRRNGDTQPKPLSPPSARKLSFRVTNPKENSRSMQILQRLRTRLPDVNCSLKLAEELMEMIRRKSTTKLKDWIARAKASGDPDLKNLAVNLLQDEKAIEAAMTESWSNGPVEGHVNRLKTIKRQMYGRAGMKLLRARVLNKS